MMDFSSAYNRSEIDQLWSKLVVHVVDSETNKYNRILSSTYLTSNTENNLSKFSGSSVSLTSCSRLWSRRPHWYSSL